MPSHFQMLSPGSVVFVVSTFIGVLGDAASRLEGTSKTCAATSNAEFMERNSLAAKGTTILQISPLMATSTMQNGALIETAISSAAPTAPPGSQNITVDLNDPGTTSSDVYLSVASSNARYVIGFDNEPLEYHDASTATPKNCSTTWMRRNLSPTEFDRFLWVSIADVPRDARESGDFWTLEIQNLVWVDRYICPKFELNINFGDFRITQLQPLASSIEPTLAHGQLNTALPKVAPRLALCLLVILTPAFLAVSMVHTVIPGCRCQFRVIGHAIMVVGLLKQGLKWALCSHTDAHLTYLPLACWGASTEFMSTSKVAVVTGSSEGGIGFHLLYRVELSQCWKKKLSRVIMKGAGVEYKNSGAAPTQHEFRRGGDCRAPT
ncbi:hypothetical protein C8R43DRAFT_941386 [Mycena crocata]|nr:hypothetical protein C8R43DRAFT_941386 [Mycena crocata]